MCSANCYDNGDCIFARLVQGAEKCCVKLRQLDCKNYHRKHPTPEQFKAEYGHEYPDDAAVWSRAKRTDGTWSDWNVSDYSFARCTMYEIQIVCACTPWGKPPREYE